MTDKWTIKFDSHAFKWKPAGYRQMNNSAGVQSALLGRAYRIKSAAESMGGTYAADVQPGKRLAHAMVKTADFEAIRKNAKYNSLLKASGG